jgi:hypothetical protein
MILLYIIILALSGFTIIGVLSRHSEDFLLLAMNILLSSFAISQLFILLGE